jgi:phage-related protein
VKKFEVEFFDDAVEFLEQLPEVDKAKILANAKIMETDFDAVYTKLLRSPIRELVVKKYRLLFFVKKNVIYFVSGFIKSSQKTPVREIEKAENVYKMM